MTAILESPPILTAPPLFDPARRYTVAEYVDIESRSTDKLQFINGFISPMAGGTLPHNSISTNMLGQLYKHLEESELFRVFNSDQKIYLPDYHIYRYADAIVVAGVPVVAEAEAHAITNPILIIEVLSKSTQDYDTVNKFVEYQSLPSFQEYVLIHQDIPHATSFMRQADNRWRKADLTGLDADLLFQSIQISVAMAKIYKNVLP